MKKAVRKKRKRWAAIAAWIKGHPFTLLAVGLTAIALMLIIQLPRKMGSLERQDAQLAEAMNDYSEQQAQNNVLHSELARVNDAEYIEALARREHGYGWYGETIYEVGNLAEVQAAEEKDD